MFNFSPGSSRTKINRVGSVDKPGGAVQPSKWPCKDRDHPCLNIFYRRAWMYTDCTRIDPGQYYTAIHGMTTSSVAIRERPWIDRKDRQRPFAPWSRRHGPWSLRGCTGRYRVRQYRNRHFPCYHREKAVLTPALEDQPGRQVFYIRRLPASDSGMCKMGFTDHHGLSRTLSKFNLYGDFTFTSEGQ